MSSFDYDLFVLGAGSAGVRAARVAAAHGARVAVCEESRVGGTCVIRGCVPKKLLVYAAHFADEFEDAAGYGWTVAKPRFSWPDLIAAKDREIDRLNQIYLQLLKDSGVTLFPQRGSFVDAHRVRVGDRIVSASNILIATGGYPWTPDLPGSEHAITSNEAFYLPELPGRILIVGGGYIACEFAGIFNGLGAKVTQSYRGHAVLRGFDEEVRGFVGQAMQDKGISLLLQTEVERIERQPGSGDLKVRFADGKNLVVDQVMYATGRKPNVVALDIENSGVEVDLDGRVRVDDYSRTSVDHIYAVGDVTSRVNLTPVAIHEGHAFADSVFGGKVRPVNHQFVPSAVFSQPPVGTVGYTEKAAHDHFGEIDVYSSRFTPLKNTLSGRKEKTLMKLIVARDTQKVVGIHIVGQDAPEIVLGFAVAVKSGLRKDQFDATLGIHPTAAEELVTMRHPVSRSG